MACSSLVLVAGLAVLSVVLAEPIMWSGAITDSTAQLRMQVTDAAGDTMVVSLNADLSAPVWQHVVASGMQAGNPTGLTSSTKYYYGLVKQYAADPSLVGSFTTHKPAGTAMNYRVAFASCAFTGYESGVFTQIADHDPLFFIHMGDLHYEDIDNADVQVREDSYYNTFKSETQVRSERCGCARPVAQPSRGEKRARSPKCSAESLLSTCGTTMITDPTTLMAPSSGRRLLGTCTCSLWAPVLRC